MIKFVQSIILTTFCIGILAQCSNKHQSAKMPLRQLAQDTTHSKGSSAWFFLIGGAYNSGETQSINVKMFAKVEGRYKLIEVPITDIRVVIDNNVASPYIIKEYENLYAFSDEEATERSYMGLIILYCPEKYLPEKLLPIGLQ